MSNREIIKKLFLLFKPYRKNITLIIIGLIISSLVSLVIPFLSKSIMDDGFLKSDIKKIMFISTLLLIAITVDNIILLFREYLRVNLHSKIKYTLFEKAFNHLLNSNLSYFTNKSSTEILSNIQYNLNNIIKITDQDFFSPITQIFNMIGATIGLLIINPKLTILILFSIPIKYLVVRFFSKKRERLTKTCIEANRNFASWFGDVIDGIKEIKQFNISNWKKEEFEEKQKKVINMDKQFSLLDSYNISFDSFFLKLITILLYILGANLFLDLNMTIGSIFAFITYSSYIITPIYSILNIKYIVAGILPSAKNFYEFLDLEVEDKMPYSQLPAIKGKINFENVQFSYDSTKIILNNLNLTIEAGEKVALIGLNGAGKSTILNLILRFYKPISGKILIDDRDINKININQYRNIISTINQQVYLFNGTIKENILLYKNVDSDKFNKAIEDSQLSDFINNVSENYFIDSNGKNLSGGQKQKIAIARAILRDTPIVIFDEATSNLDIESSMKTYKLIDTTLKNKTIIIVSHKLEILKHVDKVVLIDNGSISAIGSHDYLLSNNEVYKNLIYKHYID
ncbi:ABC transporter ATP-binding protein [Clostridium sp. YIM B02555]|uniref:ABC transporter ATP-binding protein n=1 Tax=Clostridium sp. YIM B02555 TaxID=2911968 RepID=UPI001EED9882|nr:ABC transporter ATP-binding protein [Clostridium sp. YIM B02555]